MINYDHSWWIMSAYDEIIRIKTSLLLFQWKPMKIYLSMYFLTAFNENWSGLTNLKGFEKVLSNFKRFLAKLVKFRQIDARMHFLKPPTPKKKLQNINHITDLSHIAWYHATLHKSTTSRCLVESMDTIHDAQSSNI